MAAKRKAISKTIRFEVFKRDSFTCQYCGKAAPDALLVIDHIKPVSKGGDNNIVNLVTSCDACNSGKSDRLLSENSEVEKQRRQLESLNERRQQLEMIMRWREQIKGVDETAVDVAADAFSVALDNKATVAANGRKILAKWVKKYGLAEVLESIDISVESYLYYTQDGEIPDTVINKVWDKIGGILYNRSLPAAKRESGYIRATLRRRFYINEKAAIELIENAQDSGISFESLKKAATRASSYAGFEDAIDELMEGAA
jgi:hypothetical protein